MKSRIVSTLLAVTSFAFLMGIANYALAQEKDLGSGEALYQNWCSWCHGVEGDGNGPGADFLYPRPRDFTFGLFKLRSTLSGELPTDQDLFETITQGMPGTGMPTWEKILSENERRKIVEFIKTFSGKFARAEEPPNKIEVGTRVPSSPESIEKGKQVFMELECFKCHGESGRGNGPSALELEDDWEFLIFPRNLTRKWQFRGGYEPEAIYKRLHAGLAGSPMPSFSTSLDNEKTWHLVNYILSLSPEVRPEVKSTILAHRSEGAIPAGPDDPFWRELEWNEYPLVGQVIAEPRNFKPGNRFIRVQAAYNEEEIAIRLFWDDRSLSDIPPDQEALTDEEEFVETLDGIGVQFPVKVTDDGKRPYFLMGDSERPVNIWRWMAGTETPEEFNARGIQLVQAQAEENQGLKVKSIYDDGQYRVVFKRSRLNEEADDIQFAPGVFIPISFSTWDGFNGEIDHTMALSHWYFLLLEPEEPATLFVFPVVVIGLVGAFEWLLIRRFRAGEASGQKKV